METTLAQVEIVFARGEHESVRVEWRKDAAQEEAPALVATAIKELSRRLKEEGIEREELFDALVSAAGEDVWPPEDGGRDDPSLQDLTRPKLLRVIDEYLDPQRRRDTRELR